PARRRRAAHLSESHRLPFPHLGSALPSELRGLATLCSGILRNSARKPLADYTQAIWRHKSRGHGSGSGSVPVSPRTCLSTSSALIRHIGSPIPGIVDEPA